MANIATGQKTLIDMNDLISQTTTPSNPIEGTLWLNTTENKLYIYTGGKWVFSADGISVGGRNILLNTGFKNGTTSWGFNQAPPNSVVDETTALSGKALKFTVSTTTGSGAYQFPPIAKYPTEEDNKEFAVSFYAKSNVAGKKMYFTLEGTRMTANRLNIDLTTSWVRYTKVVKGSGTRNAFTFYSNDTTPADIYIHSVMVTEGNTPSDWIPSVEDNEETISNIQETLGNMANDDIIDYQERQVLREKVADIIGYVPYDKNILKENFLGKVSGSLIQNPNLYKNAWATTLIAPTGAWTEYNQVGYDRVKTLDGTFPNNSCNLDTKMAMDMFSFDIIQIIERQIGAIPASTLANKIAWVKANIKRISCNHWGYGSSPTGNKLTLTIWDVGANNWAGVATHTGNTATKLARATSSISSVIDVNGFVHYIAYADPANATVVSAIYTDFVELEITMNNILPLTTTLDSQGFGDLYNVRKQAQLAGISTSDAKYVEVATEYNNLKTYLEKSLITENLLPSFYELDIVNANSVINSSYDLTHNATASNQHNYFIVNVSPNTTYTFSYDWSGTSSVQNTPIYDWSSGSQGAGISIGASTNPKTFTTPANCTKIVVFFSSSTSGTVTYKNAMLTLGSTAKPFVPKLDVWDVSTTNQNKIINVTKSTFRDKWLQYYTAMKDLSTLVADQLKQNVDNVAVGGANYASNGNFEIDITKSLWSANYVGQTKEVLDISTETPPFKYALHIKNTTNANGGILSPIVWDGLVAEAMVDKEITISFWLKYQNIVQGAFGYTAGRFGELIIEGETAGGSKVYRYPRTSTTNTSTEVAYITGTNMTWTKYSVTHKLSLPATAVKLTRIYFKHMLEGCTGEFWTTGLQVEVGNKVTDWKQSPLDLSPTQIATSISATPSAISLISQNIDITGKVTFNSLDSSTKSLVANESDIINPNPYFADWSGTYPVGYTNAVLTAGNTLTKTSDSSQKGNVVKFDVTVGSSNAYIEPLASITNYPYYQYYTVQSTFKLDSGTIDGAGILFRVDATVDVDYKVSFKDLIPSPTLGRWYTVTKVIKASATPPTGFNGFMTYTMGAWGSLAVVTTKSISFSEVVVRPSTEQEINSYESGTLVNSWKKTGKTTIDGGQLEADSISVTKLNVTAKSIVNNFSRNGNINNWTTSQLPATFTYGTFPTVSPTSTRTGQGVGIITSNADIQVFSDWFEVDPNKTYKVTMSIYSDTTLGSVYFGIHAGTDGINNNINVIPFHTSLRQFQAESNNFYFWSTTKLSTKSATGNRDGGWVDIEGYILGENVNVAEVPIQSSGTIGTFFAKMKQGTKYIRLRFLNFHTSPNYGDGVTSTTAYYYNPSVTEVGVGAISADTIKAGTITGVTISGTSITGASISGGTISGTTLTGVSVNGGSVETTPSPTYGNSIELSTDQVYFKNTTNGIVATIAVVANKLNLNTSSPLTGVWISSNLTTNNIDASQITATALTVGGNPVATQSYVTSSLSSYATQSYVGSQGFITSGSSPSFSQVYTSNVYASGSGLTARGASFAILRGEGDNTYLQQPSGFEARVTVNGTTGSYLPIRASSFPTGSSIKFKDNLKKIEDTDINALEMINHTQIWNYHLKSNLEGRVYDKPKVGVITEMSNPLFRDEDGIDPYTMVALAWQSIKQLSKELDEAKDRIEIIESIID